MTGQPQPHPLRCETCKHKLPDCDREALGSRVCKKIFLEDPRALQIGIPYFIDIVGCASHSSAGSQQRCVCDEGEDLCIQCPRQPSQQRIDAATIDDLINWIRISDEDSDHEPWSFKDIERVINTFKKEVLK